MSRKYQSQSGGLTIIEVVIYSVLLSLLVVNSIVYSYAVYEQNINLFTTIQNEY
jgi:hypothetical protein